MRIDIPIGSINLGFITEGILIHFVLQLPVPLHGKANAEHKYQSVVVFCVFFTFQVYSTKRSPIATKLFDDFFLDEKKTWKLREEAGRCTRAPPHIRVRPRGV